MMRVSGVHLVTGLAGAKQCEMFETRSKYTNRGRYVFNVFLPPRVHNSNVRYA